MRKHSICPPDHKWARRNFEMRGAAILKNNLNKAHTIMKKPNWLGDDTKLNGIPPTLSELFCHTHQRKKDKTWVDMRSAHMDTKFTRVWEEASQLSSAAGESPPTELEVWCKVAGMKKGKVYGLGLELSKVVGRHSYHGSSSSLSDWVRREEIEELKNKLVAVETERHDLRDKVSNNERDIQLNNQLLKQLMEKINFQPAGVQLSFTTAGQNEPMDEC
ncbi:transposase, Ptta/En/Spm, plant [Spatholobus suberectus]|nr:transposase, Ptta/En/Spm, plant [Spatholobus suberectus]